MMMGKMAFSRDKIECSSERETKSYLEFGGMGHVVRRIPQRFFEVLNRLIMALRDRYLCEEVMRMGARRCCGRGSEYIFTESLGAVWIARGEMVAGGP
jgi:hypothetical protein